MAVVGLGSNLGRRLEQLRRAGDALRALATDARWSSVYRTVPVGGPPHQPPYLNAVVLLWPHPELSQPQALLARLQRIEEREGRVRRERWGPRTLDLDLLALGDAVLDAGGLTLPHPRMMERRFVLVPLCEVAPEWRHPVTGESACGRLERLAPGGVRRTRRLWAPR